MPQLKKIKLIECPRDAMQGIDLFIPTDKKIQYINHLLQVGFDTIDFGSFVSPKAVPQMADTAAVLDGLNLATTESKVLAIVANLKGAQQAATYKQITYLGYPFSVSETFQQRNTNSSILSSLETVEELLEVCSRTNKQPVIYLSMAFGNPYGEAWNEELVNYWVEQLVRKGASIIALSDTIGAANPESISTIFKSCSKSFPNAEIGVHLHSTPETWKSKIEAAYNGGCRRFDSAIRGFGGCPMASDKLTGNIATENVISFLMAHQEDLELDMDNFQSAVAFSSDVFDEH